MITYKKMSLFDAPKGSRIVHACNAQGVWGSGIAAEFKKRFPKSFKEYKNECKTDLGSYSFYYEKDYMTISLITSKDYGKNVDSVEEILINTTTALYELCRHYENYEDVIYSNKFNSGLFNVPWKKTEAILKILTNRYNINWVVCDPNLEEK